MLDPEVWPVGLHFPWDQDQPVLSLEFSNSSNESIEIEAFIPPESPVTVTPDDVKLGKKTGPRAV